SCPPDLAADHLARRSLVGGLIIPPSGLGSTVPNALSPDRERAISRPSEWAVEQAPCVSERRDANRSVRRRNDQPPAPTPGRLKHTRTAACRTPITPWPVENR